MTPMSMRMLLSTLLAAVAMAVSGGPVAAQISLPGGIGGGLPQMPGLPGGAPGLPVDRDMLENMARGRLEQVLEVPSRLRGLVRRSDGALEADPAGWPVVRGEVVAVDLSPEGRRRALAAGFVVAREERLAALDMTTVVLTPPRGLSLQRAVERLRQLDPDGSFSFNHVHAPAGELAEAGTGPALMTASAP
ncbi:MAG: peptidase S8, partial [Brevundimonas sp.]|nr:peptidase S8 [Brevundimonas sp.]